MGKVLEVDESGTLTLPPDLLRQAKPRTRYLVAVEGDTLILRPDLGGNPPLWAVATREEWIRDFLAWAERERPPAPPLPDLALSRESIYD